MTKNMKFGTLICLQILLQTNFCNSALTLCEDGTIVGASLPNTGIPASPTSDPRPRSTAVFTQDFIIRCCGVVTKWIIVPTSDCLAAPTCAMNLSVYSDFRFTSGAATLVGVNLNKDIKSGTVALDVSEQLPVKEGQCLGWDGKLNGVYYRSETAGSVFCRIGCAYYTEYIETTNSRQIQSMNVGQRYFFSDPNVPIDTVNVRYYAIQAVLGKGTVPALSFSPTTPSVLSTAGPGTLVLNVTKVDPNLKKNITITHVRSCPPTSSFTFNPNTGAVTVTSSLTDWKLLQQSMTFEITDGCHTTIRTVNITIIEPITTTPASTTPSSTSTVGPDGSGLLATNDGKILVGLLAGALGLATAAALGLCCLCCCLKGCGGSCFGSGAGGANGVAQPADMYYNTVQSNPLLNKPSTNPLTSNYMEPRPPSYRNDSLRSSNRIRPEQQERRVIKERVYEERVINSNATQREVHATPRDVHTTPRDVQTTPRDVHTTPRDVHVRPVSPNQFYRDQLFW